MNIDGQLTCILADNCSISAFPAKVQQGSDLYLKDPGYSVLCLAPFYKTGYGRYKVYPLRD